VHALLEGAHRCSAMLRLPWFRPGEPFPVATKRRALWPTQNTIWSRRGAGDRRAKEQRHPTNHSPGPMARPAGIESGSVSFPQESDRFDAVRLNCKRETTLSLLGVCSERFLGSGAKKIAPPRASDAHCSYAGSAGLKSPNQGCSTVDLADLTAWHKHARVELMF
jgi:hypothetical protein